jgi:hypothetical protein
MIDFSIRKQWERIEKDLKNVSEDQIECWKNSFYMGAWSFAILLRAAPHRFDDAEASQKIADLFEECEVCVEQSLGLLDVDKNHAH